eukprot:1957528-Pleurochrysis_carterae.AAC.1
MSTSSIGVSTHGGRSGCQRSGGHGSAEACTTPSPSDVLGSSSSSSFASTSVIVSASRVRARAAISGSACASDDARVEAAPRQQRCSGREATHPCRWPRRSSARRARAVRRAGVARRGARSRAATPRLSCAS